MKEVSKVYKRQVGTKLLAFAGAMVTLIATVLTNRAQERAMEDRIDEAVSRKLAESKNTMEES